MSVSDDRSSPLVAIAGGTALGIAGLFVGLLLGIISISILDSVVALSEGSPTMTAVAMTAQGVGLVVVGMLYLQRHDLPWSYLRVSWPTLRELGWAVAATVGLFAALIAAMLVVEQLGLTATEHSVAESAEQNPALLLPLIPLSVLVTGPAEELLFRGVIQTRLKEALGVVAAVVAASAVFALVHIPAYAAGSGLSADLATTLVILFLLGGFLGAVYEHTGNLVVPAVAHGLYNAIIFGSSYVEAVAVL